MKLVLPLLMILAAPVAGAEPRVVKVGSLAPRESPWGQVLRVWVKAVKERTQGGVEIDMYWNATQGDEPAQVSKMRTGQLDGAVVSAVGLSLIDPGVNVLQVPGLYPGWAELDRVRDALRPRFEASFARAGFELAGWGDIGLDRLMSRGKPVRRPADLKALKPWVWREDLVLPALFQVVGVVPVATSVPEAVTEFSTGNATAVSVSALAAEQLQWSSRLDHLNTLVVAPNIGGLVLTRARLDSLSAEERAAVVDTARIATRALTERIRKEDATALERLRKRMTVVEPGPEERAEWSRVFAEARARLAQGTLPAALLEEAERLAAPAR